MEVDNLANYALDSDEDEVQMIQRAEAGGASMQNPTSVAPPTAARKPKKNGKKRRPDGDDVEELGSVVAKKDDSPPSAINLRTFSRPRIGGPEADFYSVVPPENVCKLMSQIIEEVSGILMVPAETARLLLAHFVWDKDRLIERYFEDSDKIYKDAHVIDPSADVEMAPRTDCCDICYSDIDATNSDQSSCGHTFCRGCWHDYLVSQIVKENVSSKIACAAHKCQILLDEAFIQRILAQDPVTREKYRQGLLSDFILAGKNLRFCQGTDCSQVIRLTKAGEWVCVKCTKCAATFCFTCGEPWHDPVLCQLLKKWIKKKQDDSETGNWIATNTKDCPKCHAAIEKNGGCNQMHCSKAACGVAFCWICLKIGSAYEQHGCNTYQPKGDLDSRRAALERYLFYDTRFNVHEQSLRLETNLVEATQTRMDELVERGMTWMEVQFLKKAVETLGRCRQTLMYTYPFAYFLKKNGAQDIFERNQADLEAATEKLSGFLENQVITSDINELKRNVLDSTAYVESRRDKLRNHVYEGYEDETWTFAV